MNLKMDDEDEEFTRFKNFPSCSVVQTFPYAERCDYIQKSPECEVQRFFINYILLLYCGFQPQSNVQQFFAVMGLLGIGVIMFTILGTAADKFFCPTLKVLSIIMGMSEHLAGVTLLAFGNGSPDIFTSFATMSDQSRQMFSDLLASALYVSTFVGGMICMLYPFKMQANNVLRDFCFLIFGALYVDYAMVSDNSVSLLEAVCVLFIYFSYLTIILMEQCLLSREVKKMEQTLGRRLSVEEQDKLEKMKSEVHMDLVSRHSRASINVELTRSNSYNEIGGKNDKLFKQFIRSLSPINLALWRESGIFLRIAIVLRIPINLTLLCLLPMVDYEQDRHGWSKLLNILQIMTTPLIIMALMCSLTLYGVPLCMYTLIFTVPLAIPAFKMSRTDIPPNFHVLLGVYSIFGSVFIIYACACEVVNILDVLGIVTNSSNSFLGCTLLAYGNSISDLIANITIARQGYQKMGYAACIGGPLFNMLMGLGVPFVYKTFAVSTHFASISQGVLGENCVVFLMIVLTLTMFYVITTDFYARRSLGIFCVLIYTLFIFYALMGETEFIQTYAPESPTGLP